MEQEEELIIEESKEEGPANYPWLKPLKKAGDPYSDSVRAKTKGSSSNKRKMAMRINALNRTNFENREKNIIEIVNNPQFSSIELVRMLEHIKDLDLSPKMLIMLFDKMIRMHTAIHGSKINQKHSLDLAGKLNAWREENKEYFEIEEKRVQEIIKDE